MMRRRRATSFAAALSFAIACPLAPAATDLSFDYTSFETGFGQAQFDVLNYRSINGNYMMTSTDNHRPEMVANGNQLAEFYNNWLADYNTQYRAGAINAAAEADKIHQYTLTNSTKNGPRPTWLILNELSSSLWSATPGAPSLSTYRTWAIECVTRLRDVHGYNVVALAPFQNPGFNDESWDALSDVAYVGIECYLSGIEVWNSGTTDTARFNWAKSQYQSSKNSYLNRGIPANRLFLTEHFANNNATYVDNQGVTRTTGWGRAGLASAADWDTVLMLRQDAIKAVGFDGFLAYNWGGNAMGITQAEQIQHEYYYRSRLALASQQPQWLSDTAINVNGTVIPLSWNQPLNWKGGVPNASGAIANFYRTNNAARIVTLDGAKSIGALSFNSPSSYTINPGTGGSITLNNGASAASLTVAQGAHTLAVPLVVANNVNITVTTGGLTLNNGLSTLAAGTIARSGAGTLTISGSQSHAVGQIFIANAGVTNFNSSAGGNLSVTLNAATINFNVTQNVGTLALNSGGSAKLATGKRVLNTSNITAGGGKVDLTDGAFIARAGAIGTLSGSTYTGILGMIQSGRNGGDWNGAGIVTSMSAAKGAAPLTTLATALASQALGISSSQTTTWRGQSVSGNAVLIAYTYAGDANLSGTIDADDYFQISAGFNDPSSTRSYFKGDFNYDGQIDSDDFFIIDSSFVGQGAAMTGAASADAAAVPEPAGAIALISAFASCSLRRRRAHRHRHIPVRIE
jgi:hypothetical protein